MSGPQSDLLNHRELSYSSKIAKKQVTGLNILLLCGLLMIALSVFLIWSLIGYGYQFIESDLIVIGSTVLLGIVGILVSMLAWSSKIQLNERTQTVTGVLKKVTRKNANGTNKYLFFIDNCQILWPAEAHRLCYQDVGHEVTVSGAMIDIVHTLNLSFLPAFTIFRSMRNDSAILVALNYKDTINIDKLFESHGDNYLNAV